MSTLKEFRAALALKNERRTRYLRIEFAKADKQEKKKAEIENEVRGILRVRDILEHDPTATDQQPKQIAVSTSEREIWYREALKAWLAKHPEVGVEPDNNAGLYRFALEFFVNQVVLNVKNTTLSYGELLDAIGSLNEPDPILADINFQLETKIEDIKELVSFIAAMQYLENVTSFGPARQIDDVIQSDIRSEFDKSSQYAKDFAAYQERRKADLLNKKHRRAGDGLEFKH